MSLIILFVCLYWLVSNPSRSVVPCDFTCLAIECVRKYSFACRSNQLKLELKLAEEREEERVFCTILVAFCKPNEFNNYSIIIT